MTDEPKEKPRPKYLLEQEFDLNFTTDWYWIDYQAKHPSARIVAVKRKLERDVEGKVVREYGLLTLIDRGYPDDELVDQCALVIRKTVGRICLVPEEAGRLLGTFESHEGKHVWYVFEYRVPALRPSQPAPPPADKKSSSPASPEPAKAAEPPSGSPPAGKFGFLDRD